MKIYNPVVYEDPNTRKTISCLMCYDVDDFCITILDKDKNILPIEGGYNKFNYVDWYHYRELRRELNWNCNDVTTLIFG